MSAYVQHPEDQTDLERAVDGAATVWPSLRGARVFLSGAGAGAAWMLAVLLQANRRFGLGAEAVILAADPRRFGQDHPDLILDGAVEVLAGSAADFAYPQGRFSHVVHLVGDEAAAIGYDGFADLLGGARRVCDFAGDSGAGTVLVAGIGAVDGADAPTAGLLPDPTDAGAVRAAAVRAVEALAALAGRRYGYGVAAMRFAPASAEAAAWLWTALVRGAPGAVYETGPAGIPALTPGCGSLPDEPMGDGQAMAAPPRTPEKPATFVIDVDGVVAMLTPGNDYRLCQPIPDVIAAINRLYDRGHRVVMMTARGSATGIDWEETTRGQFARWGLKFHELRFGKPAADYYVDDRILSVEMMCAMAAGRSFPPSTRAPRLSAADGDQENTAPPAPASPGR